MIVEDRHWPCLLALDLHKVLSKLTTVLFDSMKNIFLKLDTFLTS